MPDTIDPFDVPALEKALNDSAIRVSTLWLGYLSLALYLLIAAGAVTHRQLFLSETIKLPIINIDLSLIGFFLVAPLLFVVVHWYLFIQLLLLARTAAMYNSALQHTVSTETDRNRIRQRLANTLFAQIFSGAPAEREEILGAMLYMMAFLTLIIIPLLVLLTLQLKFLPYHSFWGTWTHRLFLIADIVIIMLVWPSVRNGQMPLGWRHIFRNRVGNTLAALLILLATVVLTFPGEPHSNWARYTNARISAGLEPGPARPDECRPKHDLSFLLPSNFDRLSLSGEFLVNGDAIAKLDQTAKEDGLKPYEGARSGYFLARDFQCGLFDSADLRRVDLTGSNLSGAALAGAALQGAKLDQTNLQHAYLQGSNLQGASLVSANLEGAFLFNTQLQGARLDSAQLLSAELVFVSAQGASFYATQFQNSSISSSFLTGAGLEYAQLQGAKITNTDLRGAVLDFAELQAATLDKADFQGASFYRVQLQGADLHTSRLTLAHLLKTAIWRAVPPVCDDAQLSEIRVLPLVHIGEDDDPEPDRQSFGNTSFAPTVEGLKGFLQKLHLPPQERDKLRPVLLSRFTPSGESGKRNTETEKAWLACAARAIPASDYERQLSKKLIDIACHPQKDGISSARGIIEHWVHPGELMVGGTLNRLSEAFVLSIAKGLLEPQCHNATDFTGKLKQFVESPGWGGP